MKVNLDVSNFCFVRGFLCLRYSVLLETFVRTFLMGHSQVDGSFHSPEWHAARLASLNTSHTVTWEEFKKKQKVISPDPLFSVSYFASYKTWITISILFSERKPFKIVRYMSSLLT